jgi:predicted P-loop ATPase
VTRVQEYLQHAGLRNIGREAVFQAVNATAHDHAFHPVRKYLAGLQWDGVPRIDKWLIDYLGVQPGRYAEAVGRMFLIAMVARVKARTYCSICAANG